MSMDEQTLLACARQKDDQAFLRLVELYQRPVYNLCYRMLGDAQEAEDAAQETFLRAYHHLDRYDSCRPFASWLLSIAAHHCIDILRRRRSLSFLEASIEDDELSLPPDPFQPDPQLVAERNEQHRLLQRLLLRLSPLDRAIIILRYWHELPEAEIARNLNLTVTVVKVRLHRARRHLARLWSQEYTLPLTGNAHEASLL
jgi:RNA polymerase sigma-70 factor (ECF subfamily)